MGSCKSQRSGHALDRGGSSPSMEECLPQEVLEAILVKVDRENLCTARLVSRSFCAAASASICSLTLERPSQAVTLERFPQLETVRVTLSHTAQLDPRVGAVITHLTVSQARDCARMTLPEAPGMPQLPGMANLPGMPKLRELDVVDEAGNRQYCFLSDGAEVLHRLTNLEALRISNCTPAVAMAITTTTWLTSLVIGLVVRSSEDRDSPDVSWLQHATSLRKLQALEIAAPHEALPLIGNLTGLTGLTCVEEGVGPWDEEEGESIAPLSRLSMLRSLVIDPQLDEENLEIACSLGSGSLAKLCLRVSGMFASNDWGRFLTRQTALTQLSVGGSRPCNLQHMGALRMELLQRLCIERLEQVAAEGLNALQKATSLTELIMRVCCEEHDLQSRARLSRSLGRLTQLRSLQVTMSECDGVLSLPLALGHLVALTKLQLDMDGDLDGDWRALVGLTGLQVLQLESCGLDNGDLRALLGLTGLQVLDLCGCRVTDDVVPELAALTNLRTLKITLCGVTSLAPATSILNPLRQARGWPPVNAGWVL